jgi:hypothetical protein
MEITLTFYVQLKIPIGFYEKFNWKKITWSNFSWLIISVEDIEKKHILFYILRI